MSLIAAIFAFWLLPPQIVRSEGGKGDQALPNTSASVLAPRKNKLLLMQYVTHTCSVSSIIYLFPLWVADAYQWGPSHVGYFFGVVGVSMITLQGGLLATLSRVFGHLNVLRVGAIVYAASLFVVALGETTLWMPAMILFAFSGSTVCLPLLNAIASEIVQSNQAGRLMGMTASASSVGRIVGTRFAAGHLSTKGFCIAWLGSGQMALVSVLTSTSIISTNQCQ